MRLIGCVYICCLISDSWVQYVVALNLTHQTATRRCHDQNQKLLTMKNKDEFNDIQKLIISRNLTEPYYWLGIHKGKGAKQRGRPKCPFTYIPVPPEHAAYRVECHEKEEYVCVEYTNQNTHCTETKGRLCFTKGDGREDWYHARQNCRSRRGRWLVTIQDIRSLKQPRTRRDAGKGKGRPGRPPQRRPQGPRKPPTSTRSYRPPREPPPPRPRDDPSRYTRRATPPDATRRSTRYEVFVGTISPVTPIASSAESEEHPDESDIRRVPKKATTRSPRSGDNSLPGNTWVDDERYTSMDFIWDAGGPLTTTYWTENDPGIEPWPEDFCVAMETRSMKWTLKPCTAKLGVYCQPRAGGNSRNMGPPPRERPKGKKQPTPVSEADEPTTDMLSTTMMNMKTEVEDRDQTDLIGIYIGAATGVIVLAIIITGVAVYVCLRRRHKDKGTPQLPGGLSLAEYMSIRGSAAYTHSYKDINDDGIYDMVRDGTSTRSYIEPIDRGDRPYIYSGGIHQPSTRYVREPRPTTADRQHTTEQDSAYPYQRHLPDHRTNDGYGRQTLSSYMEVLGDGSRRFRQNYIPSIGQDETSFTNPPNQNYRDSSHSYLDLLGGGDRAHPVAHDYLHPPEGGLEQGRSHAEPLSSSSQSSSQNSRWSRSDTSKSDSGISEVFMENDAIVY